MEEKKQKQIDNIQRYTRLIEKQAGKAVRPYRADGYVNLLNRYGTSKDVTEQYKFAPEAEVPDETLTMFYEGNGLFARIIDAPAEEAIKHGFELEDVNEQSIKDFCAEALDELDWEEIAMTAIKWTRLYGGAIAVMLINDGRGIDEPLDWDNIQSIDDIRIYDRSVIQPDYSSMFSYDPEDPFRTRGSRLGMPEYYYISSRYGHFAVHESRCLVFQNGALPESCTNSIYQMWGMPEYIRIHRAIRDVELAHRSGPKMLDRSVQAVYKMKDLASELATEEGETKVLKRLQAIDMARGLLNSITIDSEGEDYDFRTFQFSGVGEIIDSARSFLSALTSIPQVILFGSGVGGMSSTDDTSMENWYNFVGRIQKRMLKSNLRYLLSVLFQAGVYTGEINEVPKIKIKFNPLWSLSETEQADLEQKKVSTQMTKAQVAQAYVTMEVLDPSEVRKKLAADEEFDIENILDEDNNEDLFEDVADDIIEEEAEEVPIDGNSPDAAPAATKLPQDKTAEDRVNQEVNGEEGSNNDNPLQTTNDDGSPYTAAPFSVGVLVISDGKVLTGTRHNDFGYGLICGPGGHGEDGEEPWEAAIRETQEEFGITPTELIPLGTGPTEPDTGLTPHLFLCTEYEGEVNCHDLEMRGAEFRTLEELDQLAASLFQPFADGLEVLKTCIDTALFFPPVDDKGESNGESKQKLAESIGKAVTDKADGILRYIEDPETGNRFIVTFENGKPVIHGVDNDKDDGGPGSGNFDHPGRNGERGGSGKTFDSSTVKVGGDPERFSKAELDDALTLCGACVLKPKDTDKVRVTRAGERFNVVIDQDDAYCKVMARPDTKEVVLDSLSLRDRGTGKGTSIFSEIESAATAQGYDRITCIAGGKAGENGMNGYYTWARLGFDADLPADTAAKAKESGFEAKRVSDLMQSPEGRSWWKNNGFCLEMTFDLGEESYSQKTLAEYMSTRKDGEDKEELVFDQISFDSYEESTPQNIIEKFIGNLENFLDNLGKTFKIKSKDNSDQDGPGAPKGNDNAAKDHVVKATKAQKKTIRKVLKGTKTSNGTEVESVHDHACDRMVERGISASDVKKILESATIIYPGNTGNRTCYQQDGWRIVVDNDEKQVRTVVDLEDDDE